MAWSLEDEICKVTQASSLKEGLFELGILPNINDQFQIKHDDDWSRGGAETYIYRFWIKTENIESGYIIKACVAFDGLSNLNEIFNSWLERRRLVVKHGIKTPHLYYAEHATLLEEMIPYSFKSLALSKHLLESGHLINLAEWSAVFSKLGFMPVDPYNDLRTRGNDLVVVDFGQDLGPHQINENNHEANLLLLLEQLKKWGVLVSKENRNLIHQVYQKKLAETP